MGWTGRRKTSGAAGPDQAKDAGLWPGWPWLMLLGVACLQVLARIMAPLPRFGAHGAEYIVHYQRALTARFLRLDWVGALSPLDAISRLAKSFALLDDQYSPLLHALAAPLSLVFRDQPALDFAASSLISFLSLGICLWAVARLRPLSETGQRLARILLLLTPGLVLAARRYYYDLPMTAMVCLAWVYLLGPVAASRPRSFVRAGVYTALALLFKWAAGLYLLPAWLLALWKLRGSPRPARGLFFWCLGLGLAGGLVLPLALGWGQPLDQRGTLVLGPKTVLLGRSAAFQLGLAGTAPLEGGNLLSRGFFYFRALGLAGLGPGLTVSLAMSLAVGLLLAWRVGRLLAWRVGRLPRGGGEARRTRVDVALPVLCLVPLSFLLLAGGRLDGRYLIPLLPVLVASLAGRLEASWQAGVRGPAGRVVGLALLSMAWADGWIHHARGTSSPDGSTAGLIEGSEDKRETARVAPRPDEGWWQWWWTGLAEEQASPWAAYAALARESRGLPWGSQCGFEGAPQRGLTVLEPGPISGDVHAWRYFLTWQRGPALETLEPCLGEHLVLGLFCRAAVLAIPAAKGAQGISDEALLSRLSLAACMPLPASEVSQVRKSYPREETLWLTETGQVVGRFVVKYKDGKRETLRTGVPAPVELSAAEPVLAFHLLSSTLAREGEERP